MGKQIERRKDGIMEELGMTNEQYKGFLLNELEDWEEVLEAAEEANDEKVIKKAQKTIVKLNKMMQL